MTEHVVCSRWLRFIMVIFWWKQCDVGENLVAVFLVVLTVIQCSCCINGSVVVVKTCVDRCSSGCRGKRKQKKQELCFLDWWKRTLDRNGLDRKRLGLSQTRQGDESGGRLWSSMEDFGRDRGEGRVSGKSRDRMKNLDLTEVEVRCPGKVLNRDEKRVIKDCCEQMV
ncbi:unnamed protein product [Lactuca saligna]|uniref:Uncharacterized protein n=1 Tax=Lactuca saligna TaxID=75948 RepID=A0AA36DV64_LACSI|nr:unnamed protein product [Lactuca saligna]